MDITFYKGKRVFITGHTGFKGAWLCRALLNAGAKLTGYALTPPTTPSLFNLAGIKKHMRSITADIRDLSRLKKAVKSARPEVVFHMAAQPLVRESYGNPVYTYETNVLGTVNLLEACRYSSSIRSIVNVTTDKVYENKERDAGYRENENLCGFDPYSNSKSCSELVTASYRNSFFAGKNAPCVSTARSGNVIGGGDFAKDRLIVDCVAAVLSKKPMVIRNPSATRPYQHVLDCLSGYLLLAQKQYNKKLAGSYNFGPDEKDAVNNSALVRMFFKAWGPWKITQKRAAGPHEAHFLRLNCAKAKAGLGWKPQLRLEKAVRLTVEWYDAYKNKGDINGCMDAQIRDYFVKGQT